MFYVLLGLIILVLIIICSEFVDEIKRYKRENSHVHIFLEKTENEKVNLEEKLDAFTKTYSKLDKENTLLKNENENLKQALELLKKDKEKEQNNEEVKEKKTRKTRTKKTENNK